jgi:DNA-binding winged helix-turn-helix (wHTH) protein
MGTRFDIHRGTIDLLEGVLHTPEGPLTLTANEVALLGVLHDASPEPCSAQRLLTQGLGYAGTAKSRTVTVTIQRLRKKVEPDPAAPQTIVTVRGEGYVLRYPEQAVAAVSAPPTPVPPGRDADRAAIEAAFARGACPVGIVGPGGTGKTTLARYWAACNDAVWVELIGVSSPGALRRRLVGTLGVERGSEPTDDALSTALASRAVVLDNAEDLDAEARALLDRLLESSRTAGTRVLATSQVPLGCRGEEQVLLGELDEEAARSIVEEVRVRSGLPPLDEASLRAMLDGLGGHPLALVVAAPLFDFAGEASAVLDVPADGTEAHHPTIAASLGRVLGRLDEPTRAVVRAIAVFPARISLHAVAGVASQPLPQALRAIAALRARGLVRSAGPGGEVELLPIVRTLLRHREGRAMEEVGQQLVRWLCGVVPSIETMKALRPAVEHALPLASGGDRLRLLSHHIELLYAFGPVDDIVPEATRWTADLPPHLFAAAEVQRGRALLLAGERVAGRERMRRALEGPAPVEDAATFVQGAALVAMTLSWSHEADAVAMARAALTRLEGERVPLHIRVECWTYAGYALARMGEADGLELLEQAIVAAEPVLPARALTAALSKARLRWSPPEELARCRRLLERAGDALGRVQRAVDTADLAMILIDAHQVEEGWTLLEEPRRMLQSHRRMLSTIFANIATRLLDQPERALELLEEVGRDERPVQVDFIRAVAARDREALEALPDPELAGLGRAFLDGVPIPDSEAWAETTKSLRIVRQRMEVSALG